MPSEGSRKRRTSPSFDDYGDYLNHRGDPYASSSKAPRLDQLPVDMSPRVKPNRALLDETLPQKRRSYGKEVRSRSRSLENSPLSMSYPHRDRGSVSPSEKDSHHQPQRLDTTETPREESRSTKALFV